MLFSKLGELIEREGWGLAQDGDQEANRNFALVLSVMCEQLLCVAETSRWPNQLPSIIMLVCLEGIMGSGCGCWCHLDPYLT